MLAYVVRRLWQFVPTLLGVVLLVFLLFSWVGGDPAYLLAGKISNPEQIENIRPIRCSSASSSSRSRPPTSA
jgi:peptide/nickel transport system permease protein